MRNTSRIGETTVAQVLTALVRQGKQVLLPFGDSKRYDLVYEEDDGRFVRVQCKTGRLLSGAVAFYTCSVDSRSEKGRCIRKDYRGQIDFFGVFCPDNGKIYLVPIADVSVQQFFMRVEPPRNNQQKYVRWAKEYEIGTAATLGDNSELAILDGLDIV